LIYETLNILLQMQVIYRERDWLF